MTTAQAFSEGQASQEATTSPPKLAPLFDPAAAWKKLTLVQQQLIGAAAICQALGHLRSSQPDDDVAENAPGTEGMGWEAAEFAGLKALVFYVFRALDPDVVVTLPLPDLGAILSEVSENAISDEGWGQRQDAAPETALQILQHSDDGTGDTGRSCDDLQRHEQGVKSQDNHPLHRREVAGAVSTPSPPRRRGSIGVAPATEEAYLGRGVEFQGSIASENGPAGSLPGGTSFTHDGQRHPSLLWLAGRDPFPAGEHTVNTTPNLGKLPRLFDAAAAWDALPRDAQRCLSVAKQSSKGILSDAEWGQHHDTATLAWYSGRKTGVSTLEIRSERYGHGWMAAVARSVPDGFSWALYPPRGQGPYPENSAGHAESEAEAKRAAILRLCELLPDATADELAQFDRLLGGALPPQGDVLGKLVDPAVEPRDLAHPYDADHLLDLPDILLEPSLPGLQAADVGLQTTDVALKPGLPSLDGVHLGEELEQQGLQIIHNGTVPEVELASYTAPVPPSTPARFDAAVAWSRLTPAQQARIGVATIVHTLGAIGASLNMDPRQGWQAADMEGLAALEAVVMELLPDAFEPAPLLPALAPLGVRACRVCGCTDACGCPGGCSWVGPSLCSQCAPELVEAAAALPPSLLAFIAWDKGIAADDDPDLAAALRDGLVEIYSGHDGKSAWAATDVAKALRAAEEVAAHD